MSNSVTLDSNFGNGTLIFVFEKNMITSCEHFL